MATTTLSFQKRARDSRQSPPWDSSYSAASGSNLLGYEYGYVVVYKVTPYTSSNIQSISNIIFRAVLGGDWNQNCTYSLYLYSQDPSGYSSPPSTGLLTSTGGTKYSNTNAITWTLAGSYATNYSTLYVLIAVSYETGQVTLIHSSSSFIETYTEKAAPQINFGTITKKDFGMTIPIVNGSNYNLTCVITAGNENSPGNNAQLYSGTSSSGQFDVTIDAVQWFNTAGITNSLYIPVTITVTGGNPATLRGNLTYQETREAAINSLKPVVSSLSTQIQQAPGDASEYYPSTYIAGYSKAKVTAVITRPTSAAVSTVKLTYPGGRTVQMEEDENHPGTYTGITGNALTKDTEFTVTVTDARGLSGNGSVQVSGVVAYVLPYIADVFAYRCDSSGVETNGGDHYRIRATAHISERLPNNEITELTVGLRGAPALERHNVPQDGSTSQAFGTLSDPKRAYVLTIIVNDKISGQITRELTLKGMQRDFVINHDGGRTHVGIGTTPVGKEVEQYKDTIELPQDGLFLLGGIPAQAFHYPHKGVTGQITDPPFGKDFRNVSLDRTGEANAACAFAVQVDTLSEWSNVPDDPLDSSQSGIRTYGWGGWREVYYISQDHIIVKITEAAPKAGRVWYCVRARSATTMEYVWSRWGYIMPTYV